MNRWGIAALLGALALALVGATSGPVASYSIAPRSAGSGVWRVDTRTGEVCLVTLRQNSSVQVAGCTGDEADRK